MIDWKQKINHIAKLTKLTKCQFGSVSFWLYTVVVGSNLTREVSEIAPVSSNNTAQKLKDFFSKCDQTGIGHIY